jgi:hypothetical protein
MPTATAASRAEEARRMVAQFRATHDLWAGGDDVSGIAAGRKFLSHPRNGRLKLEYARCQANDEPALKLVIYTVV